MDTNTQRLTRDQQDKALRLVAAWLGPQMGYAGPAPTGREASDRAEGPWLHREWDWPSEGPTPTILLEGGPHDWALEAGWQLRSDFAAIGVFAEPYAGWALCLYPDV